MNYYKIVPYPPKIGTVIDTDKLFDKSRISRVKKLERLFNLFCELSQNRDLSIHSILALLYPNTLFPEEEIEKDFDLQNSLNEINQEILKTSFQLTSEFKHFNDFILEEVRRILKNNDISLPDRFKSHYFFESIEDCLKYYAEIRYKVRPTIIQVEFLEGSNSYKFDNNLLTKFENNFRAKDFYNQAEYCLKKGVTENPLFEIVLQGKYKVISHSKKL